MVLLSAALSPKFADAMNLGGNRNITIKDRWMFIYIYPVLSLLPVHIGNDNPFLKLINIPSYYTDILLSVLCTYAVGLYCRYLYRKAFNFLAVGRKELLYLAVLGVLVPTGVIIFLELVYLSLIGIPISDSSVFYLELPVVLLFCLLVNMIYYLLYQKQFALEVIAEKEVRTTTQRDDSVYFSCQHGRNTFLIPIDEVSYFAIIDKVTYLYTGEGKSFIYDFPLEQIISKIPQGKFFQLNRQVLASRKGISKIKNTATRRLHVYLDPLFTEEVFVSKVKARKFLDWLS